MKSRPLCFAMLVALGPALAQEKPSDAEPPPTAPKSQWKMISLDGKTPSEAKYEARKAANVQTRPAPETPPLVASVGADGRVVLSHGQSPVTVRENEE